MIKIATPIFNPLLGYDEPVITHRLPLDPSTFATKEAAAKAVYAALCAAAKADGQNPSEEVHIWSPKESGQGCWYVSWEAGPYLWARGACFQICGPWGYTEPNYSFDLCFTE